MASFTTLSSRALPLPHDNIDTDQITPARFLRVTHKEGLADVLFADWRKDPAFVLNRADAPGCRVLVAGDNFGCGSSREHAPWALVAWGFRAIVSTSFADIFRNNALKNGLLPIVVPADVHARLMDRVTRAPETVVDVDLPSQTLRFGDEAVTFPIEPFAKTCLVEGLDELGYILTFADAIAAYETTQHGAA
ncbi:MAG: 3-isopropylmalate dehydratase small subunit [Deltaproteobacteria bacterium]|nr:3-isopropylmalate dehydratase small subunit [Deltaproteobacteria bacterium]